MLPNRIVNITLTLLHFSMDVFKIPKCLSGLLLFFFSRRAIYFDVLGVKHFSQIL